MFLTGVTTAERIARAFHEAYEIIAPECGYETREESRKPWDQVPARNRELMIRTVEELIAQDVIRPSPRAAR
jgi:hypothetical protein